MDSRVFTSGVNTPTFALLAAVFQSTYVSPSCSIRELPDDYIVRSPYNATYYRDIVMVDNEVSFMLPSTCPSGYTKLEQTVEVSMFHHISICGKGPVIRTYDRFSINDHRGEGCKFCAQQVETITGYTSCATGTNLCFFGLAGRDHLKPYSGCSYRKSDNTVLCPSGHDDTPTRGLETIHSPQVFRRTGGLSFYAHAIPGACSHSRGTCTSFESTWLGANKTNTMVSCINSEKYKYVHTVTEPNNTVVSFWSNPSGAIQRAMVGVFDMIIKMFLQLFKTFVETLRLAGLNDDKWFYCVMAGCFYFVTNLIDGRGIIVSTILSFVFGVVFTYCIVLLKLAM